MIPKQDFVKKKFGPQKLRTLKNAISRTIAEEFPRIGGPRIRQECAQLILDVVEKHLRPREQIRHGQILWSAVDKRDRPARYKHTLNTKLVPVILDLSVDEDIDRRVGRKGKASLIQMKAVRLCHQAFEQGALLSNCDLAELLGMADSRISQLLTQYEREHKATVPRRATLQDVGTGLTHKRVICFKRFVEGKESEQIAQETHHSIEAVDRYLGQFDRVRHCRTQGFSLEKIAYVLNCSLGLVQQYAKIDEEVQAHSSFGGKDKP
jgi:hypothetical protein